MITTPAVTFDDPSQQALQNMGGRVALVFLFACQHCGMESTPLILPPDPLPMNQLLALADGWLGKQGFRPSPEQDGRVLCPACYVRRLEATVSVMRNELRTIFRGPNH
jgi:hypothetical protein